MENIINSAFFMLKGLGWSFVQKVYCLLILSSPRASATNGQIDIQMDYKVFVFGLNFFSLEILLINFIKT